MKKIKERLSRLEFQKNVIIMLTNQETEEVFGGATIAETNCDCGSIFCSKICSSIRPNTKPVDTWSCMTYMGLNC
ncbi:hypothetical protein B0I18_101389 [Taibaiella chishuiensis]|uniref:Natural product n=1 Tax=Taibaiella chishuiensis TaxID=1434707 RepID=A0A2P8DAI0_9BACT|nr:hypothetical protein B0I18_101389 [Taibaiella chishuiensis]